MLEKEPLWFPSRNLLSYNPGISDRQLWAIGMIVVQWSMTETIIEQSTHFLIENDAALGDEYRKLRNFQQRLDFWQTQIELKKTDPVRANALALLPRLKALNSQRDEVVHRMWGGGIEDTSWSGLGAETTDAGMMPRVTEKIESKGGPPPFRWRATFIRLRQMAREMATLNRDLFTVLYLPPEAVPVIGSAPSST